jgi:hypothetical protein
MKQYKMASTLLITVPLFFLFTISACAVPEQGGDKGSVATAEETVPADASGTDDATVKTEAPGEATATGLDIVMDGSSLKAFDKSMEQVKATGSEFDYRSLEGALDFLLVYDLGAKRNREKLAARLDGMTGHEINERVKLHKRK